MFPVFCYTGFIKLLSLYTFIFYVTFLCHKMCLLMKLFLFTMNRFVRANKGSHGWVCVNGDAIAGDNLPQTKRPICCFCYLYLLFFYLNFIFLDTKSLGV